jgi:hypothetical protein
LIDGWASMPDQQPDQAADSAADQVIRQLSEIHKNHSESRQRAG